MVKEKIQSVTKETVEIKGKTLDNVKNIMSQVPQITTILETALEYSNVDSTKPFELMVSITLVEKEDS